MVNLLNIRFYGEIALLENKNEGKHIVMKEIEAVMPKLWTPRMYLAALNISINHNHAIIIEAIYIRGKRYLSINDIHCLLFTEPSNLSNPSQVLTLGLNANAAGYFNVVGGKLNSILE